MLTHTTTIRVQYHETDCMAIVHHSNYIRYFETARTEMMRAVGVPYAEMETAGVMMPIIGGECKYLVPAKYDETLTIRTTIRNKISARVRFEYEIFNESGELISTGSTDLAFMDSVTRRPCRPPAAIAALNTQI